MVGLWAQVVITILTIMTGFDYMPRHTIMVSLHMIYMMIMFCMLYYWIVSLVIRRTMNEQYISHTNLRVLSWNMRGFKAASPYINTLLNDSDICVLSEHHLFENELWKLNGLTDKFDVFAKSSSQLDNSHIYTGKGHGGIAIMWRKSLSNYVQKCPEYSNDRTCVIRVKTEDHIPLYIVGVYLPQRNSMISDFDEYLYHLEYVVEKCQHDGLVAIIGDFNCHFGNEYGIRGWGISTRNAVKLGGAVSRKYLKIIDLDVKSNGPRYTFHVDGVGTSYIDHCIISNNLIDNVVECSILPDNITNTSDHLPMRVIIAWSLPKCFYNTYTSPPRVVWDKAGRDYIAEFYTKPLDRRLCDILVKHLSCNNNSDMSIDNLLHKTVECMIQTSKNLLHKTRVNKAVKPYWNQSLTKLNKAKQTARHQWIAHGKSRDINDVSLADYKEAKKRFRIAQRNAEKCYEYECITELCQSQTVDQRFFWKLINKNRRGRSHVQATLDESTGHTLYDPLQVRCSWFRYFQALYTPASREHYDDGHKVNVERHIGQILQEKCHDDRIVFSVDDVKVMCSSMKKNKAAGWDTITAEHLMYGGKHLYRILAIIYNHISVSHNVPDHFKKGVIIPIPKGNDKNMLSKDNYRGITLLSVISKVYEKLLLKWMDTYNPLPISNLQGACTTGSSCLNTSIVLRENIAELRQSGDTVYVCLLDARKAFDTVWYEGLFHKLNKMGCNRHMWLILWNFYQGFKCSVR